MIENKCLYYTLLHIWKVFIHCIFFADKFINSSMSIFEFGGSIHIAKDIEPN